MIQQARITEVLDLDDWEYHVVYSAIGWTCGHYTTHDGPPPRYCPTCTGNAEMPRLTAPDHREA